MKVFLPAKSFSSFEEEPIFSPPATPHYQMTPNKSRWHSRSHLRWRGSKVLKGKAKATPSPVRTNAVPSANEPSPDEGPFSSTQLTSFTSPPLIPQSLLIIPYSKHIVYSHLLDLVCLSWEIPPTSVPLTKTFSIRPYNAGPSAQTVLWWPFNNWLDLKPMKSLQALPHKSRPPVWTSPHMKLNLTCLTAWS